MKASILLAIKREQRNRRTGFHDGLHDKQATKSVSDAVITHVTQVTVDS